MNVDERPVRLILDTSAILAYTRGSLHVGEPMAEVADEGGMVGLPADCLVEAYLMTGDRVRFDHLVNHAVTEILDSGNDWSVRAEAQQRTGLSDAATAAVLAFDFHCDVLTSRPGLYRGLGGDGPVIVIES